MIEIIQCAQLKADDIALSIDSVVASRSFETKNAVVVAVLTKPLYLKSQREKLRKEILLSLKSSGITKKVLLTFDLDIFSKIKDNMSEKDMQKIVKIVEKRELN